MADNPTVDNGNLTPIPVSADEATSTGAFVQRFKLAASADGSEAHVPATTTDGLLVNLGANNDVSISGTASVVDSAAGALLTAIKALLGDSLATQLYADVGPYTSSQTGTVLWTPASGKKIALTHIFLTSSGTDVGKARLWFAPNGVTAYVAGTHQTVIVMNFGPNSTTDAESYPGMPLALPNPIVAANADYRLAITTTGAGLDIEGVVYGYEV